MRLGDFCNVNEVRCLRIVVATMTRMIKDLQGRGSGFLPRDKINAEEFIFEVPGERKEPWSFMWLCEILNVDPEYIRESYRNGSLLQWKHKGHDEDNNYLEYFTLKPAI